MGYKNEKQMGCITRVGKPDGLSEIDCGYRIAPLRQKDKTFCKTVILFGSRARGDFKRTSDIDLAVEGGDFDLFALDVSEETTTLLKYDIVNLGQPVQEELRESIRQEGIVIYEKI